MSVSSEVKGVCACKGIRTCVVCEEKGKEPVFSQKTEVQTYLYCQQCEKAWTDRHSHPDHHGDQLTFPGIFIQEEFITSEEETKLIDEIYTTEFVNSQSGRRKQDFGPKVNFKRKKVKSDCFTGLPAFSKYLYDRMLSIDILQDFIPVEQCHLEYMPERGSAIDPHFDDFWLWGDRLITVNLHSDTVLNFTNDKVPNIEVQVPMNRRSLLVVYGDSRTLWKHGIHREDIRDKRLAITLRELSSEFSKGGMRWSEGKSLLNIALTFNGSAVGNKVS